MGTSTNYQLWPTRVAAVVAIAFGAATIGAGGNVLFGNGAKAAGNVVGFVLWFNFLAGFVYVAAGAGLWQRRRWSARLALAIAAGTLLVFAGFGICVAAGGPFEVRTVWAMTLRSMVWIAIAILALKAARRDYPVLAPIRPAAGDKASLASSLEK
ncbi:MAG TPA: hypothetical protein VMV87_14545 [Burkholderiales bacterium]|nr:hypothetical protein [Burkholderiales bacterium]